MSRESTIHLYKEYLHQGFNEGQTIAIIKGLDDSTKDFVSNHDFNILKNDINHEFRMVRNEIKDLKKDLNYSIKSIRTDLKWMWWAVLGIGSICAVPLVQKLF